LESGFRPVSFSQTSLPLTSDIQEVLATANDLFLSFGDWIAVTSTPRRGDPPVLPDLDCGTSSPSHSGAGFPPAGSLQSGRRRCTHSGTRWLTMNASSTR
jgi:hypothetical protein